MKRKSIFSKTLAIILAFSICIALTPSAFARDSESTRKGTSRYPLYWTAYEPCFTADAPLSEARWKANTATSRESWNEAMHGAFVLCKSAVPFCAKSHLLFLEADSIL